MKVALCIPCHGDTKAKFTQCLASLIAFSSNARIELDGKAEKIEFETFIVSCSILPESRNRLVAEAIHWEADYMLWMDADHVFPRDALLRLLSRNKLVVGCNYARRHHPTSPTASNDKGLVWTTKELAESDEVEEVSHLGLGLCLVDMRAYAILENQATEAGKPHFWPLFDMEPKPDGIGFIGEDVHYFRILREAGIKVFLDHGLSWDVGHCNEELLTNAHTVVHKDKWIAWTERSMDKFKEDA